MKGNDILLNCDRSRRMEGVASGTLKPGQIVQIKAATAAANGRFTFEAYNRDADGNRPQGPHFVVDIDELQGKTATDSYADGDRVFVYPPRAGDELNLLVSAAGTGTGDAIAIGDILIVVDGTGLLIQTTGSPEVEPFMALEAATDVDSDGDLLHCICC